MDTTHTGSLVNAIMANSAIQPEVGMGATILSWTDRHAATIVEVSKSGKSIVVQEDHAKRTDDRGMSEWQTYEHTPNTDAPRVTYTLRKNGSWVKQGDTLKGGRRVAIGVRNHYYDFSF
jgi:hypothetical protein